MIMKDTKCIHLHCFNLRLQVVDAVCFKRLTLVVIRSFYDLNKRINGLISNICFPLKYLWNTYILGQSSFSLVLAKEKCCEEKTPYFDIP